MMRSAVLSVALTLSTVLAVPAVLACGFHDGPAFQRGALNWSYPDSLHVGTRVWMAQRAGRLEPDALARRDDLTIEARNGYAYLQATHWLRQLQARLAGPSKQGERPNIAVVLLGPMLWSRYQPTRQASSCSRRTTQQLGLAY